MKQLIIDLETLPDPDLSFTPPEDDPDRFPPPPFHRVAVIGCLSMRDWEPDRLWCLGDEDLAKDTSEERGLLRAFSKISREDAPRIVTWNGVRFDIPVLVARSLKHRVPQPALFRDGRYPSDRFRFRYENRWHCDLRDELQEYGSARGWSLDTLSRLLSGEGKAAGDGLDGSQVALEWLKPGGPDRVRRYCLRDVVDLAIGLVAWEYVRGTVSRPQAAGCTEAIRKLAADANIYRSEEGPDGDSDNGGVDGLPATPPPDESGG